MRLLIAGSRGLSPTIQDIDSAYSKFRGGTGSVKEVISGCARGVDLAGIAWANFYKISVARFPADWDKYGKSAGYKRNVQMADRCTHALIFWDGVSKGTKSMIDLLKRAGIKYHVETIHGT